MSTLSSYDSALADAAKALAKSYGDNIALSTVADVSAAVTITADDNGTLFAVDVSTASVTVTLPAISGISGPFSVRVKKTDSSSNVVTIAPSGSDTIDGAADPGELSSKGQGIELFSDGTGNWVSLEAGASSVAVLEAAYPVGSIYMNASAASNPTTLLGFGTWNALAPGRVLIGAGTGTDANSTVKTFTAEETGGEYTHTLATDEMPSHTHEGMAASAGAHTHTVSSAYNTSWYPQLQDGEVPYAASTTATTSSAGAHTHDLTIDSSGSDAGHNNVQPYLTVCMWVRTA